MKILGCMRWAEVIFGADGYQSPEGIPVQGIGSATRHLLPLTGEEKKRPGASKEAEGWGFDRETLQGWKDLDP